jgi:hypothetical protein
MLSAAAVAAVLAFLFFPTALGGVASAAAAGIAELCAAACAPAREVVRSATAWVRQGVGVSAPRSILGGLLVAVAAVPIARSEYSVMRMSIELVWPPGMHPELIALSFVLMTLCVGLLLHSCHSWAARVPLAVLALSLAALQSALAFHRTLEMTRPSATPAVEVALDDGLIIADQPRPAAAAQAPTAPPIAAPGPPPERNRVMAAMAALLAATLSLGGVAVGWGAFSLANPGLVWTAAVPLLVVLLLVCGLLRLAEVLSRAFHSAVDCVVESWLGRRRALGGFLLRLLPPDWSAEADEWRRARFARFTSTASRRREWNRQTIDHQRLERAEVDWEERDRAFYAAERERDQQSIAAARQASRELFRRGHIEAVEQFLARLKERRQAFLDEVSAETFQEIRRHIPKVPGDYAELLFWPLGRLRRLAKELRELPPVSVPEPVVDTERVSTQEDSRS